MFPMITSWSATPGTVYLVGAGPGDPGLITMRAVECLEQADFVLYDYLVNPIVLEHASPAAERVCLGRHGTRTFTPEEIVARLLEEARKGRTVVRLKGGDPSVFGRGADEVGALRDAGIPYEIVPGITAGLAAAAYCEIPVTHHDDASAVAFIAGQERHCKATSTLDFGALARFPGTIIFYMGVTRTRIWSQSLMDHGKPPETPVAIVRRCSWARQTTVRCTLETVADVVRAQQIRPPSLFIVGRVVDRAPALSWFADRPMFGSCVLVAGRPDSTESLGDRLRMLGAEVLAQPTTQITPPLDWGPVDSACDTLDPYGWLVMSSPDAADHFLRRLFERGRDLRWLGRVKVAAIGSGTAQRLSRYHLRPDLVSEALVEESTIRTLRGPSQDGRRILVVQEGGRREATTERLKHVGLLTDEIAACRCVDVSAPNPDVAAALASDRIDWVAVTSASSVRTLVRLYPDALPHARIVATDSSTVAALRAHALEPVTTAFPEALVDVMRREMSTPRSAGRIREGQITQYCETTS